MRRGKDCWLLICCQTKSIYLFLLVNQLMKQNCPQRSKFELLRQWIFKFWRCCSNSPPFLFLCSASLNWGSDCKFSLTLSILSETTEWVRCESRSSQYSKCHSKLITSVSRLAVRPSCSDLEKMEGEVTTKHGAPWRRRRSECGL